MHTGCPVTFNSDQVSFIAKSCSNSTPATKYKCCASALLSLRVTLTQTLPTSTTFVISEKQGAACIKDLDTALLTQVLTVKNSSKTGLQATCNILPQQIFHDSTHGCHGISTTERLFEILRKEMVDYDLIQASCRVGTSTSTCEQCRQGIMDATYVVAVSTGGSGLDPKTLQSCSDLVFLALASNSTLAYAADLGTCLYTLPGTAIAFLSISFLSRLIRFQCNWNKFLGNPGNLTMILLGTHLFNWILVDGRRLHIRI